MADFPHTCHAGCPCQTGGEPPADFVEAPSGEPMADLLVRWGDGWLIAGEAPGAIALGTRVRKVGHERGDATPVGTFGVVLSSLAWPIGQPAPAGVRPVEFFYFVEWDSGKGLPVGVSDWKIGPA